MTLVRPAIMRLSMLCRTNPLIGQMLGSYMGGLIEEGAPIVGNLITSVCIVTQYVSNPQ